MNTVQHSSQPKEQTPARHPESHRIPHDTHSLRQKRFMNIHPQEPNSPRSQQLRMRPVVFTEWEQGTETEKIIKWLAQSHSRTLRLAHKKLMHSSQAGYTHTSCKQRGSMAKTWLKSSLAKQHIQSTFFKLCLKYQQNETVTFLLPRPHVSGFLPQVKLPGGLSLKLQKGQLDKSSSLQQAPHQ